MLRKLLITTALVCAAGAPAFAADLPREKGPPVYAPPPPPAFSWTGVYIGGQVGYDWGTTHYTDETFGVGIGGLSQSGVVGGGHVGYNYELGGLGFGFGGGGFVVGIEGDVNGASTHDSFFDGLATASLHENEDFSIRGRIGYAFDRFLVYGTGGGAYGNFHTSYDDGVGDVNPYNNGKFGWTVGGGVEYAIDNNWSVRAEYRYTDFGRITDAAIPAEGLDDVSHHIRDNRVQAGFSYKFDMFAPPGPVVSKY